jgi:3-deoxy-D-manno-octulosonic-acid transferase
MWLHAVSVGEFLSLLGLIDTMLAQHSDLNILVTTTTATSAELAQTRLPKGCLHQFAPLDTPAATRRFLDHWQPNLAVFVESELWPRQIVETHKRAIPLALINARLSQRSLKRWNKVSGTARALLTRFSLILCQTEITRQAIADLGMTADLIHTTGDLKASSDPLPVDHAHLQAFEKTIGNRPLWVAASTHPGEEEDVAAAHRILLERDPKALLILAPRHPERAQAIMDQLSAKGWNIARRSTDDALTDDTQIYLADTLGEMGLWYALAPLVFVGGSFVPVGGHNPYEPAHANCAILHGPLVANFAQPYADMGGQWACRMVRDSTDLGLQVTDLMYSNDQTSLSKAALGFVTANRTIRQTVADQLTALL